VSGPTDFATEHDSRVRYSRRPGRSNPTLPCLCNFPQMLKKVPANLLHAKCLIILNDRHVSVFESLRFDL
jgi:hypothetical protein